MEREEGSIFPRLSIRIAIKESNTRIHRMLSSNLKSTMYKNTVLIGVITLNTIISTTHDRGEVIIN